MTTDAAFIVDRMLQFDLPFPLQLSDSLQVNEATDVTELAEGIYVAGDPPAEARVGLRVHEQHGMVAYGVLFGGDPYGRIASTRIRVRFNPATSPQVLDWTDDQLIAHGLRVANRIIEIYRDVVDRPALRHLNIDHVVHFLGIDIFSDGSNQNRTLARGTGPLRVGMGEAERASEEKLRARLQTDEPIEFVRELQLDMYSRMATSDYRLAVIEAETLFEAWLNGFLTQHHQRKGLTTTESDERFLNDDGYPRSVSSLAGTEIKWATGFDFGKTKEFKAWARDARDLRNQVVHGSRRNVSRDEASRAVEAVNNANTVLTANAPL
jgi:hypothetical protein